MCNFIWISLSHIVNYCSGVTCDVDVGKGVALASSKSAFFHVEKHHHYTLLLDARSKDELQDLTILNAQGIFFIFCVLNISKF